MQPARASKSRASKDRVSIEEVLTAPRGAVASKASTRAKSSGLASAENRRLIARLLRENFPRQWRRYVAAIAAMVVIAATTAASAYLIGLVTDELIVEADGTAMIALAGAVMAIFTIKGLATYVQTERLARVGNAIVADQQRRLYERVLAISLSDLGAQGSGNLITRVTQGANAVRDVLNLVVTSGVRDLLTLLGLVGLMVWQQPVLSAVAFLGLPPAIWGVSRLVRRVKRLARQSFTSLSAVMSTMQETVRGARVIKSFTLEDHMRGRMDAAVRDVEARANGIAKLSAATSPIMETMGGFAVAGAIIVAALTLTGPNPAASPGDLMSFITALLLAYEPAKRLARLSVNLERGLTGAKLMYEVIDAPLAAGEDANLPPLRITKGDVRFENVSFSYGEVPAIVDVDLRLAPGTATALVGQSGGGKSTLMSLLMRFHEPSAGRITIDGTDIATVSLVSLRRAIGYVGQDTFLFDGTVRENIAFGRPGASEGAIIEAAKAAHAWDFIQALPGGLDARVGEGGEQVSGGQRQRIAIARAFLKDAPIIALDEATSALDSHAELAVKRALEELLAGRTALVIAHRLSTVRRASRICVMENGRIVETGTHGQLVDHGGRYATLHEIQFAA